MFLELKWQVPCIVELIKGLASISMFLLKLTQIATKYFSVTVQPQFMSCITFFWYVVALIYVAQWYHFDNSMVILVSYILLFTLLILYGEIGHKLSHFVKSSVLAAAAAAPTLRWILHMQPPIHTLYAVLRACPTHRLFFVFYRTEMKLFDQVCHMCGFFWAGWPGFYDHELGCI